MKKQSKKAKMGALRNHLSPVSNAISNPLQGANPLEAYAGNPEQATADTKAVVESTEEMIDMNFFEFAKFLEGKNIGELKGFRALLQMHLDRADVLGKKLVDESTKVNFSKEDRVTMGSVFGIVHRISDRMGYIDYLTDKNTLR